MMNVYITIDVEVWTEQWKLDADSLSKAYNTYILGKTPEGDFGLPYQLNVFNSVGLTTVCFIEPLFSRVFGHEYLRQTIDICRLGNNDIQLHAHPEWLKHDPNPFYDIDFSNRYLLSEFNVDEQSLIIKEAKNLLESETGTAVQAFRAGSFSANAATLTALERNKIFIDSSFNPSMPAHGNTLPTTAELLQRTPFTYGLINEIPMTVYKTAGHRLRHTQLTACTYKELQNLLLQAFHQGYSDFVILSHSVELLGAKRSAPDHKLIKNLHRLASYLADNKDKFNVTGIADYRAANNISPEILSLNAFYSVQRKFEQIIRSKYK
ncbi:hypothetical protein [Rheinheimera sp.]|uniref:hypothetical protein n=1 Tax=Rheinheimera sp. TaxID=1869214 RepID=UPI002FDE3D78